MYSWQDLDLNQPINGNHPLNRGRVAWWLTVPGFYGAPTWWDLATGRPGALSGFATGFGWNTASNPGGAGSFLLSSSGTNRVDFGNRNWFYGATHATWSFWLRVNSNTSGRVLSQWGATAAAEIFVFEINSGPQLQIAFADGLGDFFVATTPTFTVGVWYRVVVTFAGSPSGVKVYFNGQGQTLTPSQGNSFSALAASSTSNIQLGYETAEGHASSPINVNDLSFYPSRALTVGDVLADYVLSQQMYPDVLNWQFQDVLPLVPASAPPQVLLRNFVYRPRFEPAFYE